MFYDLPPIATAPVPVEVRPYKPSWKCPTCSPSEIETLNYLQKRTNITDKNALATILGNIKQESNFHANICEGGARVSYEKCYSGGYGLRDIAWLELGLFSSKQQRENRRWLLGQKKKSRKKSIFQKKNVNKRDLESVILALDKMG